MDCLFAYTGRPLDEATDLQQNGVRWYDPATGSWLSQDPAAADVNLYRYVGNSPANATDPLGMAGKPVGFISSALAPTHGLIAAAGFTRRPAAGAARWAAWAAAWVQAAPVAHWGQSRPATALAAVAVIASAAPPAVVSSSTTRAGVPEIAERRAQQGKTVREGVSPVGLIFLRDSRPAVW